ncbi:MAG: Glu-tRNA(Gln) amidotransferase subunit GatE [Gemmatimonadota bacterium]|nr:MAG: Glu-tRNA(Gln) amidotransferase subunit GatE [Gemmatimonadota bacterium]
MKDTESGALHNLKNNETKTYEELGLKAGVEIHQQLLTDRKLFCRCPAGIYTEDHDGEVLRHMRPTLSELGEYDGTALMEFKTKKQVLYLLHRDSVCTYEMDDTPPFLVNQQALDIAIEIALLLGCTIIDEMHVARKQYLDGSIPTGFQRTAIVGVGGSLPYNGRTIGIRQVNLEEDACREVNDCGHTITFRTDRLGMPLGEVITEAEMHTPEDVAGVIEQLGRLMRVTGKIRRGIGSVRQDVNVSITGGTRVEIKGVPQIPWVAPLVHNEAWRQKALLELREELRRRGISSGTLRYEIHKLSEVFRQSRYPPLRKAVENGETIRGIKICGIRGLLNFPVQPGITFADEIAGRVRVIACLDTPPILINTDDFPKYDGQERELTAIRETFHLGIPDAVLICHGSDRDTNTAVDEIRLRIADAIEGVPNETRQAFSNGTTDFERILPGPDRMYPDTDHPPVKITEYRVRRILRRVPEKPWVRGDSYLRMGVSEHIVKEVAESPRATFFDRAVRDLDLGSKLIAELLVGKMKALRRSGIPVEAITDEKLFDFFSEMARGGVYREGSESILTTMAWNPDLSVKEILEKLDMTPWSEEAFRDLVADVLSRHPDEGGKNPCSHDKFVRIVMGEVMREVRGRFSGRGAADLVREIMEEE